MKYSIRAAIPAPKTGDTIQLAAIAAMVVQLTSPKPATVMPAPRMPPTIECVVETGAFNRVARLIHRAAAKSALSIRSRNAVTLTSGPGEMMPLETVLTTSAPANSAPAASQTAAIRTAARTVSTLPPTAGRSEEHTSEL